MEASNLWPWRLKFFTYASYLWIILSTYGVSKKLSNCLVINGILLNLNIYLYVCVHMYLLEYFWCFTDAIVQYRIELNHCRLAIANSTPLSWNNKVATHTASPVFGEAIFFGSLLTFSEVPKNLTTIKFRFHQGLCRSFGISNCYALASDWRIAQI